MRELTIIGAALLFAAPARCLGQQPTPAPAPRPAAATFTVHGHGEVSVPPDEAHVRLGVVAQAPTAKAAQDEVSRTARAVTDAITAQGVAARDLQTTGLSLQPVYAPRAGNEHEPKIVAYRASNVVTVRVRRLDGIGGVLDAALGAGANTLAGVTFTLRNDGAARDSALAQAVGEARGKAQVIATTLGLRLADVLDVTEQSVNVVPVVPMMAQGMTMAAARAETPVSAGEVTITADVTLRYAATQD